MLMLLQDVSRRNIFQHVLAIDWRLLPARFDRLDQRVTGGAGASTMSNVSKAWFFCWTELGAERVGMITTCKLHDINSYAYLTRLLLRFGDHPAEVQALTPRLWIVCFAHNPRQPDLYMACNNSVE